MTTRWIRALDLPKSNATLAGKLCIPPRAPVLPGLDARSASLELVAAQEAMFVPSQQDLRLFREIVEIFATYGKAHYASEQGFISRAKGGEPKVSSTAPIVQMTGPNGVGKSQLVIALVRFFSKQPSVQVSDDLPRFQHHPAVRFEMGTNLSAKAIFNKISTNIGLEQHYKRGTTADTEHLSYRMYQRGCCGLIADEMQFVSQSATRNALAAKILSQLSELRLPLLYVCNYSLGHKLWERPPEETDRFLSSPIIMLPEGPESADFISHLVNLQRLMPDIDFDIDVDRDAGEMHSLSFGLRRMTGRLHAFGYGFALEDLRGKRGTVKLTMDHIRKAYRESTDFARDRVTVERSFSALLQLDTKLRDYTCPFPIPASEAKIQLKAASDRQQRLLNEAESKASRTQAERHEVKATVAAQARDSRRKTSVESADDATTISKSGTPKRPKIKSALDLTRFL